jgi:hypothetical protein
LGSLITNDATCTYEIRSRIAMAKAVFHKKKTLIISKLNFNLRKKPVKYHTCSIKVNQSHYRPGEALRVPGG